MKVLVTLFFPLFTIMAFAQGRLSECKGPTWTNCFGTFVWPNDDKYVGEWKDGVYEGQGTLTYANGDKYVGEFKGGNAHGLGKFYFLANNIDKGNVYTGEFRANNFHGRGVYVFADGFPPREGIWEDNFFLRAESIPGRIAGRPSRIDPPKNQVRQESMPPIASEGERPNEQELEAARREIARLKAEAEALKAQAPQPVITVNYAAINSAHALVIGNSSYPGSAKLTNPRNDAKAISAKLRFLGFKVTEVIDASRAQMVRSLSKFSEASEKADVTLLFYAGHGVQISGINYMIPVDTNLSDISEATLQAISLNSVVERYLPGKTKLVFLDACRDNPLMTASSRGVTRGLAPINVSEGTLISYATKDGQTAADGTGQKNSPYTAALLEHLGDPQDIGIVLRTVRAKVMQRTDNRQQPWEYGSLTGGALVLTTIKK